MTFWLRLLSAVGAVTAAGILYQTIGRARDKRRWHAPGRLISVGTHRLHLLSAGQGTPTVVFEAALGASSISWSLVQPRVAESCGTCAYDRAGMGFSELGPEPRTAQRVVDELHAMLQAAAVPKPYLLVGHSYGGMTCRLFAAHYPNEVAGLLLLDPADPQAWLHPSVEQSRRLRAGALLARIGVLTAHLGIARITAALAQRGARRSARAIAATVSGGILAGRSERIIAPLDRVPSTFRPMLASIWTQPRFYKTLASQIRHMPESAAQVAASSLPHDVPLVVLSSTSLTAEERERNQQLAYMSSRSRHIVVANCGHWIQLDRPEVVIEAITEMLNQLREP